MNLKKLYAIGLCFVVSYFSNYAASDAGEEADLRIMSFNILCRSGSDPAHSWDQRKDLVVDVIRESDADTIGLQEVEAAQTEYLKRRLSKQYGFVQEYAYGGKKGLSNALLYRKDRWRLDEHGSFWLSDTPNKSGSTGWGNYRPRLCVWARLVDKKTGKGYYHFNTHLDHKSQPSRERSAVLIANRIAQRTHLEDPFVLTGDLNVPESNPVIAFFKGERLALDDASVSNPVPMTDCFRTIQGEGCKMATYNGFNPSRTYARIDYVLAGGFGKVIDARILQDLHEGSYPSDHFPTTADLRLN